MSNLNKDTHKSNYNNQINLFKLRRNHRKEQTRNEAFMEGVGLWTSFYRANPHRFVADFFGVKLKRFQCILLWAMMNNYFFMFIASRGLGKSFLSAIYICVRCILYPETKIIVTSKVISQGISVLRKVKEDLRPMSPFLQREIEFINTGAQDPRIDFRNGSFIRVMAASDSARGARGNLLLVDEFILVEKDIIDTVFKKMLTSPRHPKFLDKPEYQNRPELKERNMQMYLSSAGMKTHWAFDTMRGYTAQMLKGANYFVCHLPYQLGVQEEIFDYEGMKEEAQASGFSEMKWAIEMEAEWWGETEDAFFKFSDLDMNRKIKQAFYPKDANIVNALQNNLTNPIKIPKEKRILSVDVARMAGNANDASVFSLIILKPKGLRYERQLGYLEDMEGTDYQTQAIRIRQLFKDFECDYIVLDTKNVGTGILDNLMMPLHDMARGDEYEPLGVMNRDDIESKYPNAPKVIYAISATQELNMQIANRLADSLKLGMFNILVPEMMGKDYLQSIKKLKYDELSDYDKVKLNHPYVQTELFINEVMNLETILMDTGAFKLTTTGTARKDRYSSVSYGNYFATELERELANANRNTDFTKFFAVKRPKSIL